MDMREYYSRNQQAKQAAEQGKINFNPSKDDALNSWIQRTGVERAAQMYGEWAKQMDDETNKISTIPKAYSSKDAFADSSKRIKQLVSDGDFFNKVGQRLGFADVSENLKKINEGTKTLDDAVSFYSQWETEEEYNKWYNSYTYNLDDGVKTVNDLSDSVDKEGGPKTEAEYSDLKNERDTLYDTIVSGYIRAHYSKELAEKEAAKDSRIVEFDRKLNLYKTENKKKLSTEREDLANAVLLRLDELSADQLKTYADAIGWHSTAITTDDGKEVTWKSLYDAKAEGERLDAVYKEKFADSPYTKYYEELLNSKFTLKLSEEFIDGEYKTLSGLLGLKTIIDHQIKIRYDKLKEVKGNTKGLTLKEQIEKQQEEDADLTPDEIIQKWIKRDKFLVDPSVSDIEKELYSRGNVAGVPDWRYGIENELSDEEFKFLKEFYEYKKEEKEFKTGHPYYETVLDAKKAKWSEWAMDNPVSASFGSLIDNFQGGVQGFVGNTASLLTDNGIDMNASYNEPTLRAQTMRAAVAQKISTADYENWRKRNPDADYDAYSKLALTWGDVGSFAYMTGMSFADSMIAAGFGALTGVGQPLSLSIMGSSAANSTILQKKEQGYTDEQAYALGIISGLAEVVTEKYSWDALFSDGAKGAAYILKNFVTEGTQEGASYLINFAADTLLLTDESEWAKMVQGYKDQGFKDAKAFWKSVGDVALQFGADMLGGALCGGFSGAGGAVINYGSAKAMGSNIKSKGLLDAVAELGLKSDNKTVLKYAEQLQSGVKLSDATIGNMVSEIFNDVETQTSEDITSALKRRGYNSATAKEIGESLTKSIVGKSMTLGETRIAMKDAKAVEIAKTEVNTERASMLNGIYRIMTFDASQLDVEVDDWIAEQNTETQDGDVSSTPTAAMGATSDSGDAAVSGLPASDVANPDGTPAANVPTAKQNGTVAPVANVDGVEAGSDSVSPYDEPDLTDTSGVDNSLSEHLENESLIEDPTTGPEPDSAEITVAYMNGRVAPTGIQKAIESIADKLGVKLEFAEFYNADGSKAEHVNGYETDDGRVVVNVFSKRQVSFIFKHELTHTLKNSKGYKLFKELVLSSTAFKEWATKKAGVSSGAEATAILAQRAVESRTGLTIKGVDNASVSESDIDGRDEVLADFIAENCFGMDDESAIKALRALANANHNIFVRLADKVRMLLDKLRGTQYDMSLRQIERRFRRVLNEKGTIDNSKQGVNFSAESKGIPNQPLLYGKMYNEAMNNPEVKRLYSEAKNGNDESAVELAESVFDQFFIDRIKKQYAGCYLVAIVGIEENTRNVLPGILREYVATRTSLNVFKGVNKISKNTMKSKTTSERMQEKIIFDTDDDSVYNNIKGKRFVIVDDTVSTGTTINALARFIESAGGTVEGAVSLFKGQDSYTNLAITDEQIQQLERRYGRENVERFIREQGFANTLEQLTRRQAEQLIRAGMLYERRSGYDRSENGPKGKKSGRGTLQKSSGKIDKIERADSIDEPAFSTPKTDRKINLSVESTAEADITADEIREQLKNGDITVDEAMDAMQNLYGAIPKGELASRDIDVPMQTSDGKYTRRFARTVLESDHLTDEQVSDVSEDLINEVLSYVPVGNEQAVKAADAAIENGTAEEQWKKVVYGDSDWASKEKIVIGERLLIQAAKDGDKARVCQLVAEIAEVGTRAGQVVQALSVLKRLNGAGQLMYVKRVVDRVNENLKKRFGTDKSTGQPKKQLKINDTLAVQLVNAKGEAEVDTATKELMEDLGEQMPSTFIDKWNAWRYLSMLGNLRTHIRNLAGNAVFIPAIKCKNILAKAIEYVLPVEQRTKSVVVKKEYKDFAAKNFDAVYDILTGNGKQNPSDAIRDNAKVFKTRWLENLRKLNFNALELEDAMFLKLHYVSALAGYLQAQKVDLSNIDDATLQKAQLYAIEEAQKATYRDASAVASTLSKLSKQNMMANALVEGVLPFKKTPVNVLKRSVEYGPIGLMKAITFNVYALKKGDITASQFVDALAGGLTGTGISIIGFFLASLGMLRGPLGWGDKEDEFEELYGEQGYSIVIGDMSFTIDWMAPSCVSLFIGSELYNMLDAENKNIFDASVDAMANLIGPVFEMSMLDGINDTIKSVRFSDNPTAALIPEMLSSYAGQAIPTMSGQIARTIDDTRRTTYYDATSDVPKTIQKAWQRLANKLPGISYFSPEYIDAFGQTERKETASDWIESAAENFILPGYIGHTEKDDVYHGLKNVGNQKVLPSKIKDNFINVRTVDENNKKSTKKRYLTADEYEKYQTQYGKMSKQYLFDLIENPKYDSVDNAVKTKAIELLYDYSKEVAKKSVFDEHVYSAKKYARWQQCEKAGISIADLALVEALFLDERDNEENKKSDKVIYQEIAQEFVDDKNEQDLLVRIKNSENKKNSDNIINRIIENYNN